MTQAQINIIVGWLVEMDPTDFDTILDFLAQLASSRQQPKDPKVTASTLPASNKVEPRG